jgi:hypothetical protein
VFLGTELVSQHPVLIDRDILNCHVLIIGASGSGKTTALAGLMAQLVRQGIAVEFEDHKGEGRRLLNIFPDATVIRPDRESWNILAPVGPSEMYWFGVAAEIGRAFNLRPETWTKLPEILLRVERGLKSGEPFPSLRDFERLLSHLASHENWPSLETAARSFAALNGLLGRTARIRRAPDDDARRRLVVHEYQGLPPRIQSFLAAVRLFVLLLRSATEETRFNRVWLIDEAGLVFSKELSQNAGSGYISTAKRAITQLRFTGTGIFAGLQTLTDADDTLKGNVATILVLRCPNPADAKEAAALIGLPAESASELQNLPTGVGYVRSLGFTRPVKIQVPPFDLGPRLSDDEVERRMVAEFARLDRSTVFAPERPEDQKPLSYLDILGERVAEKEPPSSEDTNDDMVDTAIREQFFAEHQVFVRELLLHPQASVTEHYRTLGWSAGRGNRVKDQLLALKLICSQREKSTNGRPREILAVTEKGRKLFHENTHS